MGLVLVALLSESGALSSFATGSVVESPPRLEGAQSAGRRYRHAERLMRAGDYEKAAETYRDLLAKNPKDRPARLGLSYALLKLGNLNEAFEQAAEVLRQDPQSARARALIGLALLRSGVFREAAEAFATALLLNEREAIAWAGLAEIDFFENRTELSYQRLRRATMLDPNEPDYWIALGRAAARLEKFREAAEYYEKFLAVSPKMDVERRERYRGLIAFYRALSLLGITHLHRIEGERLARIPFRLQRDRPFIQARAGSNVTLNLVIDTGASISVLSYEAAEKLGIRPLARGGEARAVGGGGKFPIVYGLLDALDLGSLRIFNVPIYIRTIHHTATPESESEVLRADGFLGLSVLANFRVTIDYAGQTLILESEPAATVEAPSEGGAEIPFRTTNGGLVSAEVRLHNGEIVNFLVDTGASATVVGLHIVKKYNLEQHILPSPKIRVLGAAGVIENVDLILLPSLSMNSLEQRNVRAPVLDLGAVNESAGVMQAGILGGSFLKHFRVTFDFSRARLRLVPQTEAIRSLNQKPSEG
ncbi:MAG: aspartyl protease family protein [Blastocatellia bacterium]|nr:aspartyl protease family protein [Blastocatellia bacterium]